MIFYYSHRALAGRRLHRADALVITVITGLTNIVTTFVAIAFVDRFGRKPLLVAGSIGMAATLGTLA